MGTQAADETTASSESRVKRAVLGIGATVVIGVVWFIGLSLAVGFAEGLGGASTVGQLTVIAGGVIFAPFAYALVDWTLRYFLA